MTVFYLVTNDGSDPPMMDVLGIKASEAQHIVVPHLGVEVKDDDTGHLRRLVEGYLERKSGAAGSMGDRQGMGLITWSDNVLQLRELKSG